MCIFLIYRAVLALVNCYPLLQFANSLRKVLPKRKRQTTLWILILISALLLIIIYHGKTTKNVNEESYERRSVIILPEENRLLSSFFIDYFISFDEFKSTGLHDRSIIISNYIKIFSKFKLHRHVNATQQISKIKMDTIPLSIWVIIFLHLMN